MTSDDFSLPGGPVGQDSQAQSSGGNSTLNPVSCPSSDLNHQNREQAFRTEFNLIYTCSPLNANLGNPVPTDRHLSQSEGGFSPAESFHSSISVQGLMGDVGPSSVSPYAEPHYGGGYPDNGTPPHTSNPPQKKKASSPHLSDKNVFLDHFSGYLFFSSSNEFECDMCKLKSQTSWCAFHVAVSACWLCLKYINWSLVSGGQIQKQKHNHFMCISKWFRYCSFDLPAPTLPPLPQFPSSPSLLLDTFCQVSLPLFFQGRGPTSIPLVCWQGSQITRL